MEEIIIKIMKGFAFRNHRTKLKISDQKSQFNKENNQFQCQNPNFAVTPLPKLATSEQVSSMNFQQSEINKKANFSRGTNIQQDQAHFDPLSSSKLSKRSISQNGLTKSRKNPAKVFSVNKVEKSSSFHDIKIPTTKTLKTIKYFQQRGSFKQLIHDIITILKRQYVIQQNHIKFYSIRKQNLQDLFGYIFAIICSKDQQKIQSIDLKYAHFHFLKGWMTKVEAQIRQEAITQKQSHLNLSTNVSSYIHNHMMHQAQVGHQRSQLLHLLKDKQEIKNKIKIHEEKNNYYKRQIEENIVQIRSQIQEKTKLQQSIKILNEKVEQIKKDIKQHSLLLNQTKIAEQKIANFVNQQNNKMLRMVSQDYKRIESDIYEYAVYLQSNQLASDLNYEPAPFKVIQDKIIQQLKNVNKSIIQDEQMDIEIKNKMMRDFVILSMQKFKRKDNEMLKLLEFKTKCIRKFVSNMQMWLDNWTLKQQYLVNLRNQFLIDTNSLSDKIGQMKKISICEQCRQKQGQLIDQIDDLYHKIELNYKMGNSFY